MKIEWSPAMLMTGWNKQACRGYRNIESAQTENAMWKDAPSANSFNLKQNQMWAGFLGHAVGAGEHDRSLRAEMSGCIPLVCLCTSQQAWLWSQINVIIDHLSASVYQVQCWQRELKCDKRDISVLK